MSRRKEFKKQLQLDTLRMQMFCLDPTFSNFLKIIENKKLQNEQSGVFDFWKKACIAHYGEAWSDYYEHDLLNDDNIFETREELKDITRRLQTRLRVSPRPILLDRMWYLFFATGDPICLREAYSVGGSSSVGTHELALNAVEMYQQFRNIYEEKINEVLTSNPNYFKNHSIPEKLLVNPEVFKNLDAEIQGAMSKLRDAKEVGDDISPEMQSVLDQDDALTTDSARLDILKKFMTPENASQLDNTLKNIASDKKRIEKLDSNGKPIPNGYVEYTKKQEEKEIKRVTELMNKVAEKLIV